MALKLFFSIVIILIITCTTSVQYDCVHKGFYACNDCSMGLQCSQCVDGYYLMPESVNTNGCVKDCKHYTFLYTNRRDRTCSPCLNTTPGMKCRYCLNNICYDQFKPTTQNSNGFQTNQQLNLKQNQQSVSECSFGKYFDNSQTCLTCNDSCLTCIGGRDDQCLSCKKDQYLSILIPQGQIGECKNRQHGEDQVFQLYVTNDVEYIQQVMVNQLLTGDSKSPFINFQDAVRRADQLSASYLNSTVVIYLTKGIHFIVLGDGNKGEYRWRVQKDNMARPLDCRDSTFSDQVFKHCTDSTTEKVIIKNKIGNYFKIFVPNSLTLQRVVVDGVDSQIRRQSASLLSDSCENLRRQICEYNPIRNSIRSKIQQCDCVLRKQFTQNCSINTPNSFIEFDYNYATIQLDSPKRLLIQNCEFSYIFYRYQNFIQVPHQGAIIKINNSHFHHMSSCGSVIGNLEDIPQLYKDDPRYPKAIYSQRYFNLLATYSPPVHQIYAEASKYNPPEQKRVTLSKNSYIEIDSTTFEDLDVIFRLNVPNLGTKNFAYKISQISELIYATFKRGMAIGLEYQQYPVKIKNSTFLNNKIVTGIIYDANYVINTHQYSLNTDSLYLQRYGYMRQNYNGDTVFIDLIDLQNLNLDQIFSIYGISTFSGNEFKYQNRRSSNADITSYLSLKFQIQNNQFYHNWRKRDGLQGDANIAYIGYSSTSQIIVNDLKVGGLINIQSRSYTSFQNMLDGKVDALAHKSPIFYISYFQNQIDFELNRLELNDQLFEAQNSNILFSASSLGNVEQPTPTFNFQIKNSQLQNLVFQSKIKDSVFDVKNSGAYNIRNTTLKNVQFNQVEQYVVFINTKLSYSMEIHDMQIVQLKARQSYSLFKFGKMVNQNYNLVQLSNIHFQRVQTTHTIFHLNDLAKSFEFNNITFSQGLHQSSDAKTDSIITVTLAKQIKIRNCDWKISNANLTTQYLLASDSQRTGSIFIQNSNFLVEQAKQQQYSPFSLNLGADTQLRISNCTFKNFRSTQNEGGIFNIQGDGNFTIINSYFQNNKAKQGGVMYLTQKITLNVQSTHFIRNEAAFSAGIGYYSGFIKIDFNNITAIQNIANSSSLFIFVGKSVFIIQNSVLKNNRATMQTALMLILPYQNDSNINTIQNTLIQDNISRFSVIVAFFAGLIIRNCTFINNMHESPNWASLFVQFSAIQIYNSKFMQVNKRQKFMYLIPQPFRYNRQNNLNQFINMVNSVFTIQDTYFSGGSNNKGSAIYFENSNTGLIKNSIFQNYSSRFGVLYFLQVFNVSIRNCTFLNNLQVQNNIFVQKSSNVRFYDNRFINITGSLATIKTSIRTTIRNNTIQNYFINIDKNIIFLQQTTGTIAQNKFINIRAVRVFDILIDGIVLPDDLSGLLIQNNKFIDIDSYGQNGGVIRIKKYAKDASQIRIRKNQFRNVTNYHQQNSGISRGGAIYITGSHSQNIFISQNQFVKCSSSIGGAIMWDFYQPVVNNNYYSNNVAFATYGNNIASYPQKIQLIQYQNLPSFLQQQVAQDGGRNIQYSQNQINLPNFQSGGKLTNRYLVLKDAYDQIVSNPNSNHSLIILIQYSSEQSILNQYPPHANTVTLISKNGLYNLSQVIIVGYPGYQVNLTFTSNLFAFKYPNIEQATYEDKQQQLSIKFRKCKLGEQFTPDAQCIKCNPGTYLLQDNFDTQQPCKQCPQNAFCYGGQKIGPKPGYWRSGTQSLNFLKCFTQSACLGSNEISYEPKGTCYQGYNGILCAQCDNRYVRNDNFQCAKCPDQKWKNILILIIILIATIAIVVILIKVTLNSMARSQNQMTGIRQQMRIQQSSKISAFIKILMNHLQLIMLTASFNLQWPQQVQSLFDTAKPVADVSSRIFSLDCLLQNTSGLFYIYFLIYLLLPFIVCFLCLLFWIFKYIRSIKQKWEFVKSRVLTSIIILLFLAHPSITMNLFRVFDCRRIDQNMRLVNDLDITCYQGSHLFWSVIGGTLGILLWALGIPLLGCLLIRQQKHHLMNQDVRQKYGFLYNGYKLQSYYWECVIMYRKVGMIVTSVLLKVVGSKIQAFIVFLVVLVFLVITANKRPFITRELNNLQLCSLVTSGVTIYSGIFFLSSINQSYSHFDPARDYELEQRGKWLFFTIIILSNIFFLLSWLVGFLGEIKDSIREKFPKMYICCYLRCRKERFKKQIIRAKKGFISDILVDQIEEIQEKLKLMKKNSTVEQTKQSQKRLEQFIKLTKKNITSYQVQQNSIAAQSKFITMNSIRKNKKVAPEQQTNPYNNNSYLSENSLFQENQTTPQQFMTFETIRLESFQNIITQQNSKLSSQKRKLRANYQPKLNVLSNSSQQMKVDDQCFETINQNETSIEIKESQSFQMQDSITTNTSNNTVIENSSSSISQPKKLILRPEIKKNPKVDDEQQQYHNILKEFEGEIQDQSNGSTQTISKNKLKRQKKYFVESKENKD